MYVNAVNNYGSSISFHHTEYSIQQRAAIVNFNYGTNLNLFPLPVRPHIPIFSRGRISRLIPWSHYQKNKIMGRTLRAGSKPTLYVRKKFWNTIRPSKGHPGGIGVSRSCASCASGCISKYCDAALISEVTSTNAEYQTDHANVILITNIRETKSLN